MRTTGTWPTTYLHLKITFIYSRTMPIIYNMDMEKQTKNTDSPILLQHSLNNGILTRRWTAFNNPITNVLPCINNFILSLNSTEKNRIMLAVSPASKFRRKRTSVFTSGFPVSTNFIGSYGTGDNTRVARAGIPGRLI